MIWQNPWAWFGLATLAIPVLIHLLGRRSARTQRFPSLRFLESSQLTSTRLTRLTDIPLLAVRLGILAAATAALTLPLLRTEGRERDLGRAVVRVIVVDTSVSMLATASNLGGMRVVDAARREAARVAGEARSSVVLQTAAPASALPGAVAWLERQEGRREIVLISDFQTGTIDSVDIAAVRAGIGIQTIAIARDPIADSLELVIQRGDAEVVTRAVLDSMSTVATWTARPAIRTSGGEDLIILAAAAESATADASRRAALSLGALVMPSTDRPIAVVHRGFEGRAGLLRDARALSEPWQAELVARLRADSVLIAAASGADVTTLDADSAFRLADPDTTARASPFITVAQTRTGNPAVLAADASVAGRERLALFVRADAGSVTSAALLAAVARATAPGTPVGELEPGIIPDAALRGFYREASEATSTASADDPGSSDGRWLWALALLLLGVETWMRRGGREVKAAEIARERAA